MQYQTWRQREPGLTGATAASKSRRCFRNLSSKAEDSSHGQGWVQTSSSQSCSFSPAACYFINPKNLGHLCQKKIKKHVHIIATKFLFKGRGVKGGDGNLREHFTLTGCFKKKIDIRSPSSDKPSSHMIDILHIALESTKRQK